MEENILTWETLKNNHDDLLYGGEFEPTSCKSLQKLGIIIPYRNREEHLKLLLNHLHYILKKQQLHYKIFVVEQTSPVRFNKAALMNAAFLEIEKSHEFDCIIFHDVDMFSEDGRIMYNCLDSPKHIGAFVQKFNYTFKKNWHVGGVLAITPDQFRTVNGYHVLFYGWGHEDTEMKDR